MCLVPRSNRTRICLLGFASDDADNDSGSHFVIRSSDQSQRWADELEAFVEVSNMVDSEGRLKKRRIDSELILYYSLIVFSVFTVSFTLSIALCFTIIA